MGSAGSDSGIDGGGGRGQGEEKLDGQEPEQRGPAAAGSMATAPAPVVAGPPPPLAELVEAHAPEELVCPLTLQLLVDPVILAGDGITYSRAFIETHLAWCRDRKCGMMECLTG